ncbi:MAG: hypothetical protein LBM75_04725 [Myxococcales bacterium]|jgi:hypothetical protein|nr:hypothetical protein [Myxococcales bacterium]
MMTLATFQKTAAPIVISGANPFFLFRAVRLIVGHALAVVFLAGAGGDREGPHAEEGEGQSGEVVKAERGPRAREVWLHGWGLKGGGGDIGDKVRRKAAAFEQKSP